MPSFMETEIKEAVHFSAALDEQINGLFGHYPPAQRKSALLPALHFAQAEYGWLSSQVMDQVALRLNLKPIEVYEVASFYTMFHLKPVGKHVLEVCRTGPCCLGGAEELIAYIESKLGIGVGETSADGLFTLKTVECLASCGSAPVLQIGPDYTYHEHLDKEKIDELIEKLAKK